MKDLTGQNLKKLQGDSRLIEVRGDEALIVEKSQSKLSVSICTLDGPIIRTYFSFHGISQDNLYKFLLGVHTKRPLAKGIRIGPLFRGKQVRRFVLLRQPPKKSYFVKVEPISDQDNEWKHNGSGWVPMANLATDAPGMVLFVKDIRKEDIIEIDPSFTKKGIFFLREDHEIYVETVKLRYAFGRLLPREPYDQ